MKKTTGAFSLLAMIAAALTATAAPNSSASASNCYQNGLTPVGSSLRNLSGGMKLAVCTLEMDHSFVTIDTVYASSDTSSGNCSLRNGSGSIIWANSVSGGIHTWTTDQAVSGTGWAVYCNIQDTKFMYWTQTILK
jgi:hypothetical protein